MFCPNLWSISCLIPLCVSCLIPMYISCQILLCISCPVLVYFLPDSNIYFLPNSFVYFFDPYIVFISSDSIVYFISSSSPILLYFLARFYCIFCGSASDAPLGPGRRSATSLMLAKWDWAEDTTILLHNYTTRQRYNKTTS